MKSIVFNVKNEAEARKIVSFWNPYCSHIATLNGLVYEPSSYIIEYNSAYKIVAYKCVAPSNVDVETQDSDIVESFSFEFLPNFMSFPENIKAEMIKRSKSNSPIPFVLNLVAGDYTGGFTWCNSNEGHDFWSDVIENENFEKFNKHFKTKKDESRLSEQESPLRRGSGNNTSGVCCRKHKARVTIISPSYKEVIGRG